jgi:hypothetical protein
MQRMVMQRMVMQRKAGSGKFRSSRGFQRQAVEGIILSRFHKLCRIERPASSRFPGKLLIAEQHTRVPAAAAANRTIQVLSLAADSFLVSMYISVN